jgi:hypothetical protein
MAVAVVAALMLPPHFLAVLVVHRLAVMVEHHQVKMDLPLQQQTQDQAVVVVVVLLDQIIVAGMEALGL